MRAKSIRKAKKILKLYPPIIVFNLTNAESRVFNENPSMIRILSKNFSKCVVYVRVIDAEKFLVKPSTLDEMTVEKIIQTLKNQPMFIDNSPIEKVHFNKVEYYSPLNTDPIEYRQITLSLQAELTHHLNNAAVCGI